jgi:hypothetical protein
MQIAAGGGIALEMGYPIKTDYSRIEANTRASRNTWFIHPHLEIPRRLITLYCAFFRTE